MDNIKQQKAQQERQVVFAATSAHMLTHAYMMIFPTVLVLIANDPLMGMKQYFQLGVIGTVCYGLFGIGAIPSGMLADRYGSQRMLVICVFASALSSLAAGLSSSLYLFVTAMVFLGLAASIYHPSGLSFISRNVEKKGKAMGIHGVGGNIGLALGPILSGAVAALWGWRSAFILFAVLGFILGVMITRLNTGDVITPGKVWNNSWAGKNGFSSMPLILLLIYINCMLYGLCYRGSMMYFPKHFSQNIHFAFNDVGKAGFLVSLVTMAGALGQLLGGVLCDRLKKPEYSYLLVFLFSTPLFVAIWLFKDWGLLAISLLFAPFFFAWQPIQNTLIAKYTTQAAHGLSYGVNFLLLMGVGSLAATLGGYITDNLGVASVFAVLGFISSLSLLLVLYILKTAVSPAPQSEAIV
ncbi:MAG: MFS transporter [Deltaproteobacteria bacterium]|jgi:MFS family permease|nr:MFS transporter [Deltaproteobacteria bacterium]